MQMQVFLIVLLVALGAAKRERNHDERFALRELLKEFTREDLDASERSESNRLYDERETLDDESLKFDRKHKNSEYLDEESLKMYLRYLQQNNENSDDIPQLRRHYEDDDDEFDSDRRSLNENEREQYLEIRATTGSKTTSTGPIITLQNRALMNTRLRVLFTDDNCSPFLAESETLWAFQTKSVQLPTSAKNVKIIVEKDLIAGTWRVAYNGTLSDVNKCIRITGTTLSSTTKACE